MNFHFLAHRSLILLMYALRWILYFVISRLQKWNGRGRRRRKNKHRLTYMNDSKSQFSMAHFFPLLNIRRVKKGGRKKWEKFPFSLSWNAFVEGKIKSMRHHNSISSAKRTPLKGDDNDDFFFHHHRWNSLHTRSLWWSHAVCKLIDYFETKSIFLRDGNESFLCGHGEKERKKEMGKKWTNSFNICHHLWQDKHILESFWGALECLRCFRWEKSLKEVRHWRKLDKFLEFLLKIQ